MFYGIKKNVEGWSGEVMWKPQMYDQQKTKYHDSNILLYNIGYWSGQFQN